MLQPKRTKFRKQHKGRIKGVAKGGSDLNFGSHGLKALEPEALFQTWLPASMQGFEQMQKMFWAQMGAAGAGKDKDD